jgi:hypothetical protein
MFTVKTIDSGLNLKNVITQLYIEEAEKTVASLALIAEKAIKSHIMNTSRLPTGALADAFFAENNSVAGNIVWSIGDIDTLNKDFKMWRHINYGSEAINANWSHWLPRGHWENGRWIEGDSENDYCAKPLTPIQAHNYIEKTLADLDVAIQSITKG